MKKEFLLFVIFFGLGAFAGHHLVMDSWKGFRTSRLDIEGRKVADIRKPVKQAVLIKEELRYRENIILGAQSTFDPHRMVNGIEFGNFVNSEGKDLCSYFSEIEMVLFGDGVAISGDHPQITIRGACPTEEEGSSRGEIKDRTLMFDIFRSSDCEKNFSDDFYELENGTRAELNVTGFTLSEPTWLVKKIVFMHPSMSTEDLEFSFYNIKKILKEDGKTSPFTLEISCLEEGSP